MIKVLSNFENYGCQSNENLKNGRFSTKLQKVIRIVLYRPAIGQSDCRKASPYQLPYNNWPIFIQFDKSIFVWMGPEPGP